METKEKKTNGKRGVVLLVAGIIILAAIVVFLVVTIFVSPAKANNWYAVFLTNGRTYFGNIVLHSPENEMQINRDHILYFQKLREDSQVVASIEQNLK